MTDNTEALPPLPEKWCLYCDKAGHQTHECWSTQAINTPEQRELARLCDCAALVQRQQVPARRPDGMPASADERYLRRLLAVRSGIFGAYFDDGEAQGQERGIVIDFMRESVADIDAKLRALSVARAALTAAPSAQAGSVEQALEGLSATTRELGGYDAQPPSAQAEPATPPGIVNPDAC